MHALAIESRTVMGARGIGRDSDAFVLDDGACLDQVPNDTSSFWNTCCHTCSSMKR